MGLWEELLQPATLGEVELPVGRRRITGGRTIARKELPYVGGQEVEGMGRRARRLEVEVELFADVDEALYPERYEQLVTVLDSEDATTTWNDPVWGPIQVAVTQWDAVEDARARDGVTISIALEEVGFDQQPSQAESWLFVTSDRSRAETDGDELDATIAEVGITDREIAAAWAAAGHARKAAESLRFARQVVALIEDIDDAPQDAEAIAAKVDRVRARLESVVRLAQSRTSTAWPVLERGMRLIDTVVRIGDAAIARQGRIVIHRTKGMTSIYELASQLYGDPRRVDEILRRNPLPRPLFIPAGTVLRVLER